MSPVAHATFTIERTYPVASARVFAAFADADMKRRWFAMPGDWIDTVQELDFRVGGRELNRGGPPGGPVHRFDARFHDIVDGSRIVYSYDLYLDDDRVSVSLATVELRAIAGGTRMVFTEQGAFFHGPADAAEREHGTELLVDALDAFLDQEIEP